MTPQPNTTQAPFPNYLLAEDDVAFLKRPELRPVRLQLELLKPELLLVEHNIKVALSLAHRVYLMGKAHIGFNGTVEELKDNRKERDSQD